MRGSLPAGPWSRLFRPHLVGAGILVASLASSGTMPTQVQAQVPSVRVISHGDRGQPLIALTFDDGISPTNCRRILATLVEQDVPATFFPFAEAMTLDPAFWRLVAAVGDPIGDHTYSHPQLPRLGLTAQVTEIDRGRRVAEKILGRPILRVFRPPYGAYNATTLSASAQAGFPTVLLWDVSDRDTSRHGTIAQMRAAAEMGTNGSIVLMHCGPNATTYLLADVIAHYRAKGFRFVTIPELLGLPWASGPTRAVTPEEILGGFTPLPALPSGGPITGPNGYSPPPIEPTSSPRATPVQPTPSATSSPSPVVTASSPATSDVPASDVLAASGGPVASDVPSATDPNADRTSLSSVAIVIGLAILAATVGAVSVTRRSRRR